VPSERVERRLAVVLVADVAGYSRLMGADEAGTLACLKAHRRELIDPEITEHRGRIVKTTGDGLLVEFASAVDAASCAVELQQRMGERNAGVAADQRIELPTMPWRTAVGDNLLFAASSGRVGVVDTGFRRCRPPGANLSCESDSRSRAIGADTKERTARDG
jgi:hypothetical protein